MADIQLKSRDMLGNLSLVQTEIVGFVGKISVDRERNDPSVRAR